MNNYEPCIKYSGSNKCANYDVCPQRDNCKDGKLAMRVRNFGTFSGEGEYTKKRYRQTRIVNTDCHSSRILQE